MKILRLICCCCLLLVSLVAIMPAGLALAEDVPVPETIEIKEEIEARAPFPTMEAIAGSDFEFALEFRYSGVEDAREFELRPTPPQGWEAYMTPTYEKEKKIKSLTLRPAMVFGDKIRVVVSAPFWPLPEPGEYKVPFEVVSSDGSVSTTTELTAVITAKYILDVSSATERYNTTATAGKEKVFSLAVTNLGTAPIDNINFSSSKPDGWDIKFAPDKVDLIEAFDDQAVDVTITPPAKAVAGDYMITIQTSGKQASAGDVNVRVTVESPTIWGWVGIAIILLVIAGLAVIFWRFSRR